MCGLAADIGGGLALRVQGHLHLWVWPSGNRVKAVSITGCQYWVSKQCQYWVSKQCQYWVSILGVKAVSILGVKAVSILSVKAVSILGVSDDVSAGCQAGCQC